MCAAARKWWYRALSYLVEGLISIEFTTITLATIRICYAPPKTAHYFWPHCCGEMAAAFGSCQSSEPSSSQCGWPTNENRYMYRKSDSVATCNFQSDLYQIENFRCFPTHASIRPYFALRKRTEWSNIRIGVINFATSFGIVCRNENNPHVTISVAVQLKPAANSNEIINFPAKNSEWLWLQLFIEKAREHTHTHVARVPE